MADTCRPPGRKQLSRRVRGACLRNAMRSGANLAIDRDRLGQCYSLEPAGFHIPSSGQWGTVLMNGEIGSQTCRCRILAGPLLLAALASGCNTLSTQIFPQSTAASDMLREQANEPAGCSEYHAGQGARFGTQRRLCLERARADLLRQDYVRAVVDHSTQNATLSALLVAIAGAAGYQLLRHGVTDAPTQTMSYLAASGATIYGYSSLTHSPPRQLVYLAGAEALSCVFEASAAIQIPAAELNDIMVDNDALRAVVEDVNLKLGSLWQSELQRVDRCKTRPSKKSACSSGTTGAGELLFTAAPPVGCASRPASSSCDRRLENATRDLDAAIRAANELHAQVVDRLNRIERLVPQIRSATDRVSYAVGKEVVRTETSAAAALLAIKSMRGVLAQLSGTAESGALRTVGERSRYSDLEPLFYQLRSAEAPVKEHKKALRKRLNAFAEGMDACQSVNQVNRITLTPVLDSVELTPGQSYTFTATGTSVAPTVNLFNDSDKAIEFKPPEVNGNLVKATLRLGKSDKDVHASLQFSSPGASQVEVELTYFAPGKVAK
jgi:hypothetical protein